MTGIPSELKISGASISNLYSNLTLLWRGNSILFPVGITMNISEKNCDLHKTEDAAIIICLRNLHTVPLMIRIMIRGIISESNMIGISLSVNTEFPLGIQIPFQEMNV